MTSANLVRALLACFLAALLLVSSAGAQTCYPMLIGVYPTGIQRGQTAEVTVTGRYNFAGAYGVQFESAGFSAVIVPAADPAKATDTMTFKVTVAADAPLGPQEFRVATPRGVSSIGQLVVAAEPQVLEKEGNNAAAQAGAFELPAVLNGMIQGVEDVDCFKFSAAAGDQVVFSCLAGRLQDKIHDLTPGGGGAHCDPILVLTDEAGRELAVGDDYYGPDPVLVHRFEKAGTYVLQIRDVRYLGMAGWTYCVTATRSPFLLGVYPMAGQRGQQVEVRPVGFNLGEMQAVPVAVPRMEPDRMELPLKAGGGMTNPVPFLLSDAPQFLEQGENNSFEKGTPVRIPGGLNGRIEAENDVDCFRFAGVKGQSYTFEVSARRYGSSLDSSIQVLDAKGTTLASNDDALGKDSRLDWACPADGEYALQITDLHSRGGDPYVYHVAAAAARPDFLLQCDDDKALIGPGSGYAMYVSVTRRNGFAGEVKLSVEGLPPGVTATADRIPAGGSQACVVFRAAPDAKPAFSRIRMWGTAEVTLPDGKKETVRREVAALQEIYSPGGGRTRFPVNLHTVSVTGPSDVLLKLSASRVELKPGGTAEIEVDVTRQNDYKGNVILDVYLRHLGGKFGDPLPPGVSLDEAASKTLLSAAETKGKIVLKAAADAPEVPDLPIAVLGQVSINFVVKVSHAGEPVLLSVKK
jgi:hypothetical protein